MVKIISDDPVLQLHIKAHVDLLISSGGWVHEDVAIKYQAGEISVHSAPTVNAGDRIIVVPEQALVPVSHAELALVGDEIVFDPGRSNLSIQQARLLDIQCEIFNLSGKVRNLRQSLPRYLLGDHPELLQALSHRRIPAPGRPLEQDAPAPRSPENLLKDFLNSRILRWPNQGGENDTSDMLMSVIDYINHDSRAAPHQISGDQSALVALAPPRNTECFVQYGPYDAQDVLLTHGYLDDSAEFVRAASFSVAVEDFGTVHFGAEIAFQSNKHPAGKGFSLSWSFPNGLRWSRPK